MLEAVGAPKGEFMERERAIEEDETDSTETPLKDQNSFFLFSDYLLGERVDNNNYCYYYH